MKKIFTLILVIIIFSSHCLFSQTIETTTSAMNRETLKLQAMMEALKDPALAPVTYTIGPGDIISLNLWGNVNAAYRLTVGQDENVFIPSFKEVTSDNIPLSRYGGIVSAEKVPSFGEIKAGGLALNSLKAEIEKRVRRYFCGVNVRVSLAGLRQISVAIYGSVFNPGVFLITPLYRLSNLIEITGGITETGSYRNITIKSTDGSSHMYDIYEFFYKGRIEHNPYLKAGDIVAIPQAVMSVKIRGEVFKEGNYELKEGERLKDIIEIAGGLEIRGVLAKAIEIYNIKNPGEVRKVDPYKLFIENDSLSNIELKAGDVIYIGPEPFTVAVVGEVMGGGVFEYEHGLTDFYYYLALAGGYSENANPGNVRIVRYDASTLKWKKGVEIKPGDRIIVGRAQVRDWKDLLDIAVSTANIALIIWTISKSN